MTPVARETRNGLALGVAAYAIWGVLPLYLRLLGGVPALQVVAHRIAWSLVLLIGIVLARKHARAVLSAARGRTLLLLCGSAAMIAINWIVFIGAALHGHVLEASLGYFINPLVSIALAMVVLGERIGRVQQVAVGIAAAGVVAFATQGGGTIWISLVLAFSFAIYGLLRKIAAIDALGGLTVETGLLLLPALAVIAWAGVNGDGAFGRSTRMDVLLVLAGPVTAAPLLLFAAAARRLSLATLGLLQFVAPTFQFLEAMLLFGERVRPIHFVTFALIWIGCALYVVGGRRRATPA